MPSLEQVRTRKYLTRGVVGQVGDNGSTLITMRYIGTGTITSVTVTAATDVTMVTVVGTTTYTDAFTWAAYTTVRSLVAAINATGRWEAKILDCLASTATAANFVIGGLLAADSKGNYNIMGDTGVCLFMAYRLTYDRTFLTNNKVRASHRVAIQEIDTTLTLGATDANAFKIYECSPGDNSETYPASETLIYQKTPVSGAPSAQTWASGESEITGEEGDDLLFVVSDTVSFAATNTITVIGKAE